MATLTRADGNQAQAARVLGISDRTLREKVKKYRQQECVTMA
ncbi:MAG: helix-turn-helix domain-containing protein [Planctomycetota bacterium]